LFVFCFDFEILFKYFKLKYVYFSPDLAGYDCQDRVVKEEARSADNFADSFVEQPTSDALFNQVQCDPQYHPPFNSVVPQTENFAVQSLIPPDQSACYLAASHETEASCLQQIYQTDQMTFIVTIPKQNTEVTKESANFQIKIEKMPKKAAQTKAPKAVDWIVSTW
jgi:hypothetical protein